MQAVVEYLWIYVCLWLIIAAGVGVVIQTRGRFFSRIVHISRRLYKQSGPGISPFRALMTALSGTVGTGNIAGVAAAVYLGGPGVIFYMWIIGFFALAVKYAEGYFAVRYRCYATEPYGGPMYYISQGLPNQWGHVLATIFSCACILAALGIGSSVQANSVAHVFASTFDVPYWLSGLMMMIVTMGVIVGGVHRISAVATAMVPSMIFVYFVCVFTVLFYYSDNLWPSIKLIVDSGLHGTLASDGFLGASLWAGMYYGAARGIFSNEAGMGSAAIAHASSSEKDPASQGAVAAIGTLIDTFCVCTLTGLTVIVSGAWKSGFHGAAMTAHAVSQVLPFGNLLIGLTLVFFGFSTILAWGYYSEAAMRFLSPRLIAPFRFIFLAAIFFGSIVSIENVWLFADLFNALMVLPHIIALIIMLRQVDA